MWWILIFVSIIVIFEVITSISRCISRITEYKCAVIRRNKTKKPLVVIGDPDNGGINKILGRMYDGGDICIDLTGCPGTKRGVKSDALSALQRLPDNSCVIYESCVLEYTNNDEFKKIVNEIKRVSGGDYFQTRIGLTIMYLWYFPALWTGESHHMTYKSAY